MKLRTIFSSMGLYYEYNLSLVLNSDKYKHIGIGHFIDYPKITNDVDTPVSLLCVPRGG